MNIFDTLNARGYVYQSTNLERIKTILNGDEKITFYLGIDPTADSLHIGHFFALMMFRYLQEAGHQGILVIGGATALIGDPSGKSDMRKMLTKEQVEKNLKEVRDLAKRFIITEGDNGAIIYNNADWFSGYEYIDFMRDIGVHFNVNVMLSADAYAKRIKQGGLTFLEMGYMLMQSFDFVYLNKKHNCILQIGGSDQWGNIVAGTTLKRKLDLNNDDDKSSETKDTSEIFGLTCPLLLTKEGNKMGKTEKGTLWVAREKTIPYDFYQYFYNVDDSSVEMLLKLFTRISLEEIGQLCSSDILKAKRRMAYEITKLVHGQEEADKVLGAVDSLFGKGKISNDIPSVEYPKEKVSGEGALIVDVIAEIKFLPSKGEARRMIQQKAITIGNTIINDVNHKVYLKDFNEDELIIKKGKKTFIKVVLV